MRGPSRVVLIASSTLLIGAPAAIACSPQDYMSPEDWQALSPAQQAENTLGHTHEAESPPPAQGSAPAPAIDAGSVSTEDTRTGAAPESSRDDASEARAGLPTDSQQAARFVRQSRDAPKLPEGAARCCSPLLHADGAGTGRNSTPLRRPGAGHDTGRATVRRRCPRLDRVAGARHNPRHAALGA